MRTLMFIVLFLYCSAFSISFAQPHGLETGDKTPEINLPSPKGQMISSSSLKGKMVLIDFWASWCAPCVKEQTELADLYKKYKKVAFINGKGFEIYGVSLDSKKTEWEQSINRLGITWIQVSDLKFWRSPVAKTYNIQSLPFNVLIDADGNIIAKNLHRADLENKIANFLKR